MSRVGEGIGSNGLDSATNTGDDQPRTQPSVARPALPVRVHANADDVAPPKRRRTLRVVLLGSATTLLAASVLALVASSEPDGFDVTALAAMELGRDDVELVAGAHTTAALIGVSHTLLSKSGGYLRNDVLPPWSLLDNMPSWERGVVIELRDS
ncbi:MAG: DUF2333 family protein, partial [Gammaproteobacteria bacterium]|nr:DUF2333 family protein [Gammaproteobacteria bacterium]